MDSIGKWTLFTFISRSRRRSRRPPDRYPRAARYRLRAEGRRDAPRRNTRRADAPDAAFAVSIRPAAFHTCAAGAQFRRRRRSAPTRRRPASRARENTRSGKARCFAARNPTPRRRSLARPALRRALESERRIPNDADDAEDDDDDEREISPRNIDQILPRDRQRDREKERESSIRRSLRKLGPRNRIA